MKRTTLKTSMTVCWNDRKVWKQEGLLFHRNRTTRYVSWNMAAFDWAIEDRVYSL